MKQINIWALLAASVLSYAVNFVWFMFIFSEPYLQGLGKTDEELALGPNGIEASIMQLVGNVVMAFVLSWLAVRMGMQTALQGAKLGAIAWVGFVAAVLGPMYAFQAFSLAFFLITAGSVLLTFVITGAIVGGWQAKK
ncbi:MAG TPA: DUF1761 domain-containing protein [Candidatus Saccharimonadales bacterium]|nr:DUF1761 domain-containing protein [Candidatus Saccharimonadales bacterium]